jgi:hypothetical protein
MPKKNEQPAEPQAEDNAAAPEQAQAPRPSGINRRGPRSKRAKLLGLVEGNRAFRDFKLNKDWNDAQLESAIRDFMRGGGVQSVAPNTRIERE